MTAKTATMSERTQRSVFVGNIPYDATEAQLSELFSRAGQVVNFRLMYDRETGRSKGYGFCEFADKETAASALRNMNNMEFNGRNLRIDAASGERTKEEIRQMHVMMAAAEEEACYGPSASGVDARRSIGDVMSNMPRDKLREFLHETKVSLRTNPNETRAFLLENPQVAYALLEAAVICQLVDQKTAISLLHPPYPEINHYGQAFADLIVPNQVASLGINAELNEPSAKRPALGQTSANGSPWQTTAQAASSTSALFQAFEAASYDSDSALAKFESLDEETKRSIALDLVKASDVELALLPASMKQIILTLRARYRNVLM